MGLLAQKFSIPVDSFYIPSLNCLKNYMLMHIVYIWDCPPGLDRRGKCHLVLVIKIHQTSCLPSLNPFLVICALLGSPHYSFSGLCSPCYQSRPCLLVLGPSAPYLCALGSHPELAFDDIQCWDRSKRKEQERTPK